VYSYCGSSVNVHFNHRARRLLCGRHCGQFDVYGKLFRKTSRDKNEIIIVGDIAKIILRDWRSQKKVADTVIDVEDINRVKDMKWHLCSHYGYAIGPNIVGTKCQIRLARLIINAERSEQVDHINGDKLDNRKSNLRIVNYLQNSHNVKMHKDNKLGVKGVCESWYSKEVFRSEICVDGKKIHLGYFKSVSAAKRARVAAEKKYFGEYRRK
jgi:hypothetical protein